MVEPTPVDETTQALGELRAQALTCIRCRLAEGRRQVVFGEGHPHARIMLIGQGPSESDDRSGHPYSGPSGPVLDKALAAAGLRREDIWLTNITKCLALAGGGGPRRIREPKADEVRACRIWLDQEIALVQPKVIVCIGGPAAKALIAPRFRLMEQHGQVFPGPNGIPTLAVVQPALVLRLKRYSTDYLQESRKLEHDRPAAVRAWNALIADLRRAAGLASSP